MSESIGELTSRLELIESQPLADRAKAYEALQEALLAELEESDR